ncbi:MAG TPA: phosphoribosylanthranilate isomerase [Polyangiaceae bacterium]|nr:phosphoribosylanthranilate isomerase [Polyangiaceae bacterium]
MPMGVSSLYVKICGLTRAEDAVACAELGATALGLNFVPTSRRRVDERTAREIADAVRGRVELVGVMADVDPSEAARIRDAVGLDYVQLHGDESAEVVEALLPRAFKAVRIGDAEDARLASDVPGERILVDAKVSGELGGTGKTLDFSLVRRLAEERPLLLAGGLTPENVTRAVRVVRPFGVDVASGVESSPGVKDRARVAAFIEAAQRGVS